MYVYRILNKVNRRLYIGSTNNYLARKIEHFCLLRNNKHSNKKLQYDFNLFGEANFEFDVILNDIKDRTTLLLKEYDLILKNKKWCYNIHMDCPVFDPRKKQNWKMFKKGFTPNGNKRAKQKLVSKPKAKNVKSLDEIRQWKLNRKRN